jgi:hypothetical protein
MRGRRCGERRGYAARSRVDAAAATRRGGCRVGAIAAHSGHAEAVLIQLIEVGEGGEHFIAVQTCADGIFMLKGSTVLQSNLTKKNQIR